ncbi:MAG: DUF748 domain-containing protein [Ignavibacteriales bacterium]|nr:MAG: DUF748 domain-containing protein [Ignavibacteriales bacterium]
MEPRFVDKLKKAPKKILIALGIIIIVLIGVRIALPYIVKDYVNNELDNIPEYKGSIEDVDINLWRGAYVIQGVKLLKTTEKIPVPFFSADEIDLSVEWGALFDGSIVGEISFLNPTINFVNGPTEAESQTGVDKSWQETIKELFPLKINRFEIINGQVHYRDFHSDPKVDVYLQNVQALATNLTNSEDLSEDLVANISAKGIIMETGNFRLNSKIDPYTPEPTFDLDFSLRKIDLPKLNNFLKAYASFDVQEGTFDLDGEFAASNGRFEGYVKPIFRDMKVFSLEEEHENVFEFLWESVVGLVTEIFENQPKEQVATKVPFSGNFKDPSADIWATIGMLIRNAFIEALVPGIERSINLEEAKE